VKPADIKMKLVLRIVSIVPLGFTQMWILKAFVNLVNRALTWVTMVAQPVFLVWVGKHNLDRVAQPVTIALTEQLLLGSMYQIQV